MIRIREANSSLLERDSSLFSENVCDIGFISCLSAPKWKQNPVSIMLLCKNSRCFGSLHIMTSMKVPDAVSARGFPAYWPGLQTWHSCGSVGTIWVRWKNMSGTERCLWFCQTTGEAHPYWRDNPSLDNILHSDRRGLGISISSKLQPWNNRYTTKILLNWI